MEEEVREDLISVLKQVLAFLKDPEYNISRLRELSNHTIHNASIYQDEHSISVAILIYSLSKVIERVRSNFDYAKIKNLLSLAAEYLEDNNVESYHEFIRKIFGIISRTDSKFRLYIQEVIKQASIRKGSKLYEHGISASKTAQILGISLWDFYDYLGATNISDAEKDISSVRERLEFARSLFS
ncbi:hypothetical protein GF323_06285 [Candidatus Woesearchaeota archaeon]|nr:hypothetical protein [Candidatus Woesearchaeota archaeon]